MGVTFLRGNKGPSNGLTGAEAGGGAVVVVALPPAAEGAAIAPNGSAKGSSSNDTTRFLGVALTGVAMSGACY